MTTRKFESFLISISRACFQVRTVAQMLFFESDEECEVSYKDRGGKYQGQRGVTLPRT